MTQTQIEEQIPKKSNKKKNFSHKIADLAGSIISKKGYVSTIDLFLEIGWLKQDNLNDWNRGKISYLERVISANLSKISKAMKELKSWAIHSKLKPSFTAYKHKGHQLRFSKTGQLNIETAYSTHYILIKTDQK
ncbi:MAG: hypothetical protein ACYCQI_12185 [Gammaproteobacteria bacterium]